MRILACDFGTSSTKAGIYDEFGNEILTTKCPYDYEVHGLSAQIDPEVIFQAFCTCVKNLGAAAKKVDVLSIDTLSPSVIPMDKDGNALYPCIIHLDRRSYPQAKQAVELVGKDTFLKINGNLPFAGGIGLTSIMWIRDNAPEAYKNAYQIGFFDTFIHKRLTGNFLIDPTNASFVGLYNTFTGKGWSKILCKGLGIDIGKLPEIVPTLSLAGKITRQAARLTGLKEGLPVVVGANDSTSGAYGAGAVNSGDIVNISGSSEIMTITTDNPVPNPKILLRTSVEPDKWIYLSITVGGFALEWFRKNFCKEMDANYFYGPYIAQVTESLDPGTIKFHPHLSGDRHSLTKKRGSFTGLTMDSTRDDMLRAVLLGSFEPMIRSMNIIGKTTELNSNIYLTGGVVSDAYHEFKERIFKGYTFETKDNCPCLGNVKAAVKVMSKN